MMELIKKHIHMNRRRGSVAAQITLDDDFNAVSYTHLDVYKRQPESPV